MHSERLMNLAQSLLTFGVALLILLVVRRFLIKSVRTRAALVADALSFPSALWCMAGALAVSLRLAELTEKQVRIAETWIVIFLIVSFTMVAASLAVRALKNFGEREHLHIAVAGLSLTLTRIFVYSIGVLILLGFLGISIIPILTALGVGGLAVALALQDTLANFFAGVHILIEEPISVGDFIRLGPEEEEGIVTDIGWRTTRVLTGKNNVIVIPNTKITSGILTNFSIPQGRVVAQIDVMVAHEADMELVRKLAVEAASTTEGVIETPSPALVLEPGVLPTHIQSKLLFSVPAKQQLGPIRSQVYLKMLELFRQNGVPFPVVPDKIAATRV